MISLRCGSGVGCPGVHKSNGKCSTICKLLGSGFTSHTMVSKVSKPQKVFKINDLGGIKFAKFCKISVTNVQPFENSEGNLGIANALYEHLSSKLPISRMQRDLTDSTVLRNVGVPISHSVLGLNSTLKGLNKLLLNRAAFDKDLENNWAVVAEAIQTILRREAYPNPYEALKALTRKNEKINQESMHEFINSLDVSSEIRDELLKITPHNYTGI